MITSNWPAYHAKEDKPTDTPESMEDVAPLPEKKLCKECYALLIEAINKLK